MTNRFGQKLTAGRKLLLIEVAILAVGVFMSTCLLSPIQLRAQSRPASPLPSFEAADVHASDSRALVDPTYGKAVMRTAFSSGRYELRSATLVDLIKTAWGIDADTIFGGPVWLDSDRFDVIAQAPANSTDADRARMLQALLMDRFKLATHTDTKPVDVLVLTAGKRNAQLKNAPAGEAACERIAPQNEQNAFLFVSVHCHNTTMAEFADQLHKLAGDYVIHAIVDETGLKGSFDFTLKWTPRLAMAAPTPANGAAEPVTKLFFFDAVNQQLGLKLSPGKRPMPALVVDSVNRGPTPNAQDLTKKLPAAPKEFDVAVVKPSEPGSMGMRLQPQPGGRFAVENLPLKALIMFAWDIPDNDGIVGVPKWAESDRFNILAKTDSFPGSAPPPLDAVRTMLRSLITERFKMTVHNEAMPVPVWVLVVSKGGAKLKQAADASSRSGCTRSPVPVGNGSSAIVMSNYVCQNTTMMQFAESLHQAAGGYVDHKLVDETGLKGAYDFSVSWTPKSLAMANTVGGPGQNALDPMVGMTLYESIEKQLGLRLEGGQKRVMPTLVIDHIEPLVDAN